MRVSDRHIAWLPTGHRVNPYEAHDTLPPDPATLHLMIDTYGFLT